MSGVDLAVAAITVGALVLPAALYALAQLPWRSWWRRLAVARKRARVTAPMKLTTFDAVLKDRYPLPGTRIKQYVIDERNEMEWERNTCPRVQIAPHEDNTGTRCRNSDGRTLWVDLHEHDCCDICTDHADRLAGKRADIKAWIAERAARPPITTDREALSNEVAPPLDLRDSPALRLARGGR